MRLPSLLSRSLLLLVAAITLALAADPKYPSTVTLSYEFVNSASSIPSPLATINYDPKSLRYTLTSWTPPPTDSLKSTSKEPTSAPLLRILSPSGSSTVTTLSTFAEDLKQHINLYLSSTGDSILSASITSLSPVPLTEEEAHYLAKVERAKARGKPIPPPPKPNKPKKVKKADKNAVVPPEQPVDITPEGQPKVNLFPEMEGPKPKLLSRAPPAVDEQGNEVPAQDVQEKTFLQKYWWVMLAGMVLMMGAGGGDSK